MRFRASFSFLLPACVAFSAACAPTITPPNLTVPVNEQEVPVIVAVGPVDTTRVVLDGQPVGSNLDRSLRQVTRDMLHRTNVFKDVVLLDIQTEPGKKPDPEKVLAAARAQNADALLTGEVKEFFADSVSAFGSEYRVMLRLQVQLFNAHTGALVWKKTEHVAVQKAGELDQIVMHVAMPSVNAGLLPPLVEYIQTDYAALQRTPSKATSAEASSGVFGGAELARIDAELAPPASRVKPKDHAYAVIIGVEDYRDLPTVDYAKRDAEMVKTYLTKALGYREQNVVMLLNDRVTKADLEARLERWLPKQVGDNKDAEVFVYYGGHGAPDPNTNQAFLVPYNGDPAYLETSAYPLNRLYETLGKLPAQAITVVMDSCFSGAGGRSVIQKGARPMLIKVENPLVASQNMIVISAAAGNQISNALPEKRHGLFTYYFLKGLQGEADANKDGAVDVEELYAFMKPQVETAARRMNAEQSPQLLPGADLLGDRAKLKLIELKK
jgi:PBP1b-binding outer membrane lipoprotein LpoB